MHYENDHTIDSERLTRRKNARPRANEIRSQSKASRDPERGRQCEVEFLNTDKVYRQDHVRLNFWIQMRLNSWIQMRMKRDKVKTCSTFRLMTTGILLKNLE